jgi:cytochrome c biogenesis protein CcdA
VTAECDVLQQQLAQLHLAAAELGSTARISEAQQQLAQMTSTLAAADKEHAARVAGILRKLQVRQAQLSTMFNMNVLVGAVWLPCALPLLAKLQTDRQVSGED